MSYCVNGKLNKMQRVDYVSVKNQAVKPVLVECNAAKKLWDFCETLCNECEMVTTQYYFYHPQRTCSKRMFLHLSVILFIGGRGVSDILFMGGARQPPNTPRQTPLDRYPTPGRHPPGQTQPPRADPQWADTPPWANSTLAVPLWQTSSPPDGYCCGWYTSYWNAFLLTYY